ncbi:terpene cyclase/mutase family protein [Verrucomicrobiaceae bacterium R5-34]|uniref:Terpene cyclase/mutase family protein n=1 Tax=Oceaniferula flava TaxID=2800421 RepID=A0AAE2V8M6_9BACT|nr:terpene cyclase/mutase family protein [Oceaniferula flavus]MBK1829534.1 terpene cyclase/mutase family protein [Verrucomicrobiaceae bacterium R5-34]MBK1853753.1 terpene cyclase/mutase family protein [Oceaniferula flavus]MBM1135060.1 terpene cyclase/mutase family protein [Oceaniferula flavus]
MKQFILSSLLLAALVLPELAQAQSLPRRQNDTIPAQVETMYTRGLRYLSNSQDASGSWGGGSGTRPGVVALCTLAFLAHGEDPNYGPYAQKISKSLNFLFEKQKESSEGYIGPQMYDHGFATLALAECYGMVDDKRIAPALKKAVDLILKAQKVNPKHGWRYDPTTRHADTTVSGCQIVALLAARNAGVAVPDEAIEKGLAYMRTCRSSNGAYGYTSKGGGRLTLTAIGSLCWSLAKKKDEAGYKKSTEFLKLNIRTQDNSYPFYFRYYMSQALFQADEELWNAWNKDNIRLLSVTQLPDGSWAGNHGNAFSTAGALLSLALNYRFLPIYEK